jgi:hypothetical protein
LFRNKDQGRIEGQKIEALNIEYNRGNSTFSSQEVKAVLPLVGVTSKPTPLVSIVYGDEWSTEH